MTVMRLRRTRIKRNNKTEDNKIMMMMMKKKKKKKKKKEKKKKKKKKKRRIKNRRRSWEAWQVRRTPTSGREVRQRQGHVRLKSGPVCRPQSERSVPSRAPLFTVRSPAVCCRCAAPPPATPLPPPAPAPPPPPPPPTSSFPCAVRHRSAFPSPSSN